MARVKRKRRRFEAELRDHRINATPEVFEAILDAVFRRHCPDERVEWMTFNPSAEAGSVLYVEKVRVALAAAGVVDPGRVVSEEFILRKVTNLRKCWRSPEKDPPPGGSK